MQELLETLYILMQPTMEIDLKYPAYNDQLEAEIYGSNVSLYFSLATLLGKIFTEYERRTKYNRQRTFQLKNTVVVLKIMSQVRLGVSYLIEEIAAHEESIKVTVSSTQRKLAATSWSPQTRRFISPMSLGLKDYTLHLLMQKSSSLRSMSPNLTDIPASKTDRQLPEHGKYSNLSNLYMENVWKKGQGLKRPSSKYRFVKENRAARALDRALNSRNRELANSVRQLMSKYGSLQQKTFA